MTNSTTIKAITLDLDDTLWPVWPAIRKAEKHLYDWMLRHAPATAAANSTETLAIARRKIEELYPQHKHDLSFYRREAIRMLLKEQGEDESLAEIGFDIFFQARQNVTLFEDTIPALQKLHANYPIVGITNGNANLQAIGLSNFFKHSISAQKFGVGKPDKKIFLEAARVLELRDPSEILHIGDDFELDVTAAKRVGFKTAWVKRPELDIPDVPRSQLGVVDFFAANLDELCQQLQL